MIVIMLKVERDTVNFYFLHSVEITFPTGSQKKIVLDRMVGMMIVIMNDNFSMKKNVCARFPSQVVLLTGTVCTFYYK